MVRNVIIIGTGPAGLTAALYAARANLEPLIFEGRQPGGQLTITTDVENYPGFPEGIMGPDLMDKFRKQAQRFGAETLNLHVDKVDLDSKPFKVYCGDKEYLSKTIIISTGASAKLLGLESESKLMGYGVSACATCDGFFFRDQNVALVGGGNTAVEEALYLTNHASKVTVIHRRDAFRAEKIMQDRLFANPKVEVMWEHVLDEVTGESDPPGVSGARVRNVKTDVTTGLDVSGVFIAIGHDPATAVFKGHVAMDDEGYILTAPDSTATAIPGVFAAGDVVDKVYRQAVTAAGMGCMAALEAEKFIAEHEDNQAIAAE